MKGAELCIERHRTGMEWFDRWEKCKLQLHICTTTVPKVTLDAADRANLVSEGKKLVEIQNETWDLFVNWVTSRCRQGCGFDLPQFC